MRALPSGALAAIQSRALPMVLLVEMDLTSPLFLCTANVDITIGGNTYYGLKGLGRMGVVTDTPAEIKQMQFELSGVPSESIALVLNEPVQGKAVRVKVAIFDPANYSVLDVRTRWVGLLDTMSISDGKDTCTIAVTAEHAGIDLTRPSSSFYSDDEQQALHPAHAPLGGTGPTIQSDKFFQYTSQQVEQRITWPSKDFGRK